MRAFLETADAAQVLELMREAQVSVLQLTEPVAHDGTTVTAVLLCSPPRLVLRRADGSEMDAPLPPGIVLQLASERMWRHVRQLF